MLQCYRIKQTWIIKNNVSWYLCNKIQLLDFRVNWIFSVNPRWGSACWYFSVLHLTESWIKQGKLTDFLQDGVEIWPFGLSELLFLFAQSWSPCLLFLCLKRRLFPAHHLLNQLRLDPTARLGLGHGGPMRLVTDEFQMQVVRMATGSFHRDAHLKSTGKNKKVVGYQKPSPEA